MKPCEGPAKGQQLEGVRRVKAVEAKDEDGRTGEARSPGLTIATGTTITVVIKQGGHMFHLTTTLLSSGNSGPR